MSEPTIPGEPDGSADGGSTRMVTALVRLHQALQEIAPSLDLAGAEEQRTHLDAMVEQLNDYVIPRAMTIEAPLLTVVGGSTGAGKSTLVNSLVGTRVTKPGLLRPTTRSPVLVHHPDDREWFGQDRLLPDLERVDHPTNDPGALQLVASDLIKPGLAILDAPDVDSVEEQNRLLAAELLGAADLWLFVTSAARYADQVPWEFLKVAAERSASVAVVLDRTPDDAVQTVAAHLARMLASRGLKDSPLFIVYESEVTEEGMLPGDDIGEIRGWLDMLADDVEARHAVVAQTLDGAVREITLDAHRIADLSADQHEAMGRLRAEVDEAYDAGRVSLDSATADGSLLSGELLTRWQEFIGDGTPPQEPESAVDKLRERVTGGGPTKPQQGERVTALAETALVRLISEETDAVARRLESGWQETPAGRALLARHPDRGRVSAELRARVEREVREWHDDVRGVVREGDADTTSQSYLAYGVDGLSAALTVVVLGSGGGVTAPGQKLLETVVGEETVGVLVSLARESLERRIEAALSDERGRHGAMVEALELDEEAPARLRQAARRVDDARFAGHREGGVLR